jgi:hypothetical protein
MTFHAKERIPSFSNNFIRVICTGKLSGLLSEGRAVFPDSLQARNQDSRRETRQNLYMAGNIAFSQG